jgi:hypothetical protein
MLNISEFYIQAYNFLVKTFYTLFNHANQNLRQRRLWHQCHHNHR